MSATSPGPTRAVQIPPAGHYRLDPDLSTITFRTRHMFGLGAVNGSFALRGGEISVLDPPTESTAQAEIAADSFTTGNATRDRTVRSAKYLDTANHPLIRFTSQDAATADGAWTLTGVLDVRGTQRPVRLAIEQCELTGGRLTASATTRIDRTEFGITAQPGMTGRYLDLTLDLTSHGPGETG
ncbi:YceI family protein [Amycolatopsis alkalitolerans]|uniref:YceI family protein n=1 Tax=Amycolatopsis alkalitolerans TaxID=2547244 RepID=A0A5C4M2N5_9PSEU|nr:YceI family protein [Amycolatopsis alkalitolerans]TNC26488.1 YceI family protein [Amycolatopsis alkalitolerans]